ncbi:hypothetical protein DFH09DRAFT_1322675 [Mycena vulgaris]|nr:hypothetical protein DFH09DRAFT_1322675 [Mycena vulgaris]
MFGHAHPALTVAAARASGRYGHVIFLQVTHTPALQLAESLLHDGPGKGWASRVFCSDDGSAVKVVSLKMVLCALSVCDIVKGAERKALSVLRLRRSSHDDTIGAMDAFAEEWASLPSPLAAVAQPADYGIPRSRAPGGCHDISSRASSLVLRRAYFPSVSDRRRRDAGYPHSPTINRPLLRLRRASTAVILPVLYVFPVSGVEASQSQDRLQEDTEAPDASAVEALKADLENYGTAYSTPFCLPDSEFKSLRRHASYPDNGLISPRYSKGRRISADIRDRAMHKRCLAQLDGVTSLYNNPGGSSLVSGSLIWVWALAHAACMQEITNFEEEKAGLTAL